MTLFIIIIFLLLFLCNNQLFFLFLQKNIIHQLSIFPLNLQGPEKTLVLKSCFIIKN